MHKIIQLFLLLTFVLSVSVNNTWADSACNPECSTHGQFCFTGGMDGATCVSCNVPINANPTSVGTDDNPNSCPWTLTCTNGQIFQEAQGDTPAGCYSCPSDHVSSLGANSSYIIQWDGNNYTYYNTNNETIGQPSCYIQCGNLSIPGGHIEPDTPTAPREEDCTYNSKPPVCYNTGGTCNLGFHQSDRQCVANAKTDGCSSNNIKFYNSNSDDYTECLVQRNSCNGSNNHFTSSGFSCDGTQYGTCNPSIKQCQEISILRSTCGTGYEITGDARINPNPPWYSIPTYTYTECRCVKTDQPIDNGLATKTYSFSTDGYSLSSSPESIIVTTCDPGSYLDNEYPTECTQVSGYYFSPGGSGENLNKKKCPYGSATMEPGATSVNNCVFTAYTQFKDKTGGTYNIPFSTPADDDAPLSQHLINKYNESQSNN